MSRVALLAGVAIGVLAAVVLGKDRLNDAHAKAKDVWEGPQVQGALSKADRFVADKAPTLHGVGEAVVDSLPRKGDAL
jgi:hypothetical protein